MSEYIIFDLSKINAATIVSLIVLLAIVIFSIIFGTAIRRADPLKPQNKRVFIADWFVSKVDGFIQKMMGKPFEKLGAYFAVLFLYLPTSFMIGLLGFSATPLGVWTIPMTVAIGTFVLIHATAIKYQKLGYFKRFTSPFAVFLPINIVTTFVPIISLSFRILGNVLAGTIILTMIYAATETISALLVPYNFLGAIVAPVFHLYFDVFGAYIQTTVFIFLSGIWISQEAEGFIPEEANI